MSLVEHTPINYPETVNLGCQSGQIPCSDYDYVCLFRELLHNSQSCTIVIRMYSNFLAKFHLYLDKEFLCVHLGHVVYSDRARETNSMGRAVRAGK